MCDGARGEDLDRTLTEHAMRISARNPVGRTGGRASTGLFLRLAATLALSAAMSMPPAARAGGAEGTRDEVITDPTMNDMRALSVTIPASWHFQGVLFQGDDCVPTPFVVWRANSPDGLSFVERMPIMGWTWGSGPMATAYTPKSCLPLHGPMSAPEFLKFVADTMKLQLEAEEPVPAEENAKAQKGIKDAQAAVAGKYAAMHMDPPKTTRELAQAIVRYNNGTFAMRGRLKVMVDCTETTYAGAPGLSRFSPGHPVEPITGPSSTVDKCLAGVNYFTGPENKFAALIRQWEAPGMMGHTNVAWQNAWVQRNAQQMQQKTDQMIGESNRAFNERQKAFADQGAARQRQAQEFNHQQAVRQQMHEEFLSTMQRGTNASMARTQANMNARSTAASDWVDYALDRQTVMDPATRQVSKLSNAYSYTWLDSTGKVGYQTNDPNANPNGVLQGTWTRQEVVHGNGTP